MALRNVLLADDGRALVCDFGLSRAVDESPGAYYAASSARALLPLRWMSPEALMGTCTRKSDVWMFGVTAWELVTGGRELPYAQLDSTLHVVPGVVTGALRLRLPAAGEAGAFPACPAGLSAVVEQCLQLDAARRPSMHGVVRQLEALIAREDGVAAPPVAARRGGEARAGEGESEGEADGEHWEGERAREDSLRLSACEAEDEDDGLRRLLARSVSGTPSPQPALRSRHLIRELPADPQRGARAARRGPAPSPSPPLTPYDAPL